MEEKKYNDNNRGALFKNDRKEKETHPDYKGSMTVEGKEYWVSGWVKVSSNGNKFLSVSLTEKEPKPEQAEPAQPAVEDTDEIPF